MQTALAFESSLSKEYFCSLSDRNSDDLLLGTNDLLQSVRFNIRRMLSFARRRFPDDRVKSHGDRLKFSGDRLKSPKFTRAKLRSLSLKAKQSLTDEPKLGLVVQDCVPPIRSATNSPQNPQSKKDVLAKQELKPSTNVYKEEASR